MKDCLDADWGYADWGFKLVAKKLGAEDTVGCGLEHAGNKLR